MDVAQLQFLSIPVCGALHFLNAFQDDGNIRGSLVTLLIYTEHLGSQTKTANSDTIQGRVSILSQDLSNLKALGHYPRTAYTI